MTTIEIELLNVILDWQEKMEAGHPYMNILASDRRELLTAILKTFNVTEKK